MNNFYTDSETICDDSFEYFNNHVKWFTNIQRNTLYNSIDWTCTSNTGSTVNVELKFRTNHINTFNTIYIEPHKLDVLYKEYNEKNIIPLYINFFQTKENVAIWNLLNVKQIEVFPNVKIWDKGAQKHKYALRYGLLPKDAWHYKYNNKIKTYERIWQEEEEKTKFLL